MGPQRAFNVPRILAAGTVLGLVAGALFSQREPHVDQYSPLTELGLFAVIGALLGLFLAGLFIAIFDRDR